MNTTKNIPSHITKGDVFDDLGFSHSEASALKVKADLLDAILGRIRRGKYTQGQVVDILDEHQSNVSVLMQGKITKVSIEKLLRYADRLGLRATVSVRPISHRARRVAYPVRRVKERQMAAAR